MQMLPGARGPAMTDESGSIQHGRLPAQTMPQQLSGNLLRLAKGGNCVDQGTQRPLPVSLGALIPNYAAGAWAQLLGCPSRNMSRLQLRANGTQWLVLSMHACKRQV